MYRNFIQLYQSLFLTFEKQANLNINGNKDENGKYDANSITLAFYDGQFNTGFSPIELPN